MACAHAKFTGELGVCIATSGPGAIHLLNGLYDAKLDHQPVLAIVGQQARSALGGNYQQEVDLQTLFKDVAHEYVHMATEASQVTPPDRPRRAHRAGRANRDLRDRAQRPAGSRRGGAAAARARHGAFRCRLQLATGGARGGRAASCGGDPQLRRARGDARRRRRAARHRRGDRGRRSARRGRGQGAARQGRRARRAAVCDRLDRPARNQAELGHDGGLRHAADGRLELSLLGVPARGRPGAGSADRYRRAHARNALPDGGQPRRRQRRDPARAAAAVGGEGRSRLARADRGERGQVVGGAARRAPKIPPTREPSAGVLGALASGCPTVASFPRTPVRRPTGTRAT